MCGIVAMLTTSKWGFVQNDIERFNQLLVCDSVRGPDSTGVFAVNSFGNLQYMKEKGNPFNLIESEEYQQLMTEATKNIQFMVGHNRKATVGKITDKTAHPFAEGNIVLVHNGTLSNHTKLTEETVEVDSHAITHAISEKGYKEALKELEGAFTLVWYDIGDKTLRFVRNDKRPLHILKYDNKTVLSSEAQLGKWIIQRDRYLVPKVQIEEVKPGVVYSIHVDKPSIIEEEEVKFHTYQAPVVVTPPVVTSPKKKTPNLGSEVYPGWDGYECHVGDRIVVRIEDLVRFKTASSLKVAGYIKGSRIFPNQPECVAHLSAGELDDLEEAGETVVKAEVERLVLKNGKINRIYVKDIDYYEPNYDVTGQEVFNEEWKLVDSYNCKKCGKITYWKDIMQTRFKFKTPTKHRIICKECVK